MINREGKLILEDDYLEILDFIEIEIDKCWKPRKKEHTNRGNTLLNYYYIIILGYESGLKLNEILNIDRNNFFQDSNFIILNNRKTLKPRFCNEIIKLLPFIVSERSIQNYLNKLSIKIKKDVCFRDFRKSFSLYASEKGYSQSKINEFLYGLNPRSKENKNVREYLSDDLRIKILLRDNFKCKLCGDSPPNTVLEIDHIVPISKGGKTNRKNLQTLCKKCNRGKLDNIMKKEDNQ